MIKEEKPQNLPALRPVRNKTFASLIDGLTLTVAGILIIVIFMVYMTQVSFNSDIDWKDAGFEGGLMYICTVSFYLLLRSYSARKGRSIETYAKAAARIERNNETIVQKGYARHTHEYCRAWEEDELNGAREHVLADAGIKLAEFNGVFCKYNKKELVAKFPELSEYQLQTILRAKRIKRLEYDESYLSVYDKHGRRCAPSGGFTTRKMKRWQTVQTLVTTALTSSLSISMALSIVANPSFATVVMCLVKIVTILGCGVWGMIGGYNMSSVREVEEMGAKADEQERFIKWCETAPAKEVHETAVETGNAAAVVPAGTV